MSHDELLAKINETSPIDKYDTGWQSALRAVVELHKPFENVTGVSSTANERVHVLSRQIQCSHCTFGTGIFYYPCPTIQSIEKELT
jgi:hypothetical protein